ncbi:MAG: hypothetical protein JO102_07055 [Elusimicrobia bacterium]|nr:hypothetical protein [Elusimicrobiota bacterium]
MNASISATGVKGDGATFVLRFPSTLVRADHTGRGSLDNSEYSKRDAPVGAHPSA